MCWAKISKIIGFNFLKACYDAGVEFEVKTCEIEEKDLYKLQINRLHNGIFVQFVSQLLSKPETIMYKKVTS